MLHTSHIKFVSIFTGLIAVAANATPTAFTGGITFNNPNTVLSGNSAGGLEISSLGGMMLQSGLVESAPNNFDGGVHLIGSPVRLYLGSNSTGDGRFEVWGIDDFYNPAASAALAIDSAANTAEFKDVNVSISGGTLTIGGSPALTQASSGSYLSGQGFLQTSGLSTALASATPPTSTAWTSAYLPRGTVSNGALFALGSGVTASASYAMASGDGSSATGQQSRASGFNSSAAANYSTANGDTAIANGNYSFANGYKVAAKSSYETVFGRYNVESNQTSPLLWKGYDGLFRVGNGISGQPSDALTVLKNGQTTLTNKDWKAAVATSPANALADPASSEDSGGNALVVDGHTVLNGKVIISVPQGDISMGIYE